MYNIGDRIVYPMHGAGIIEAIEEKEILGKRQKYYIMKMPIGDMKVMIPIANIEEIGIRDIINSKEAEGVIEILKMIVLICVVIGIKDIEKICVRLRAVIFMK